LGAGGAIIDSCRTIDAGVGAVVKRSITF
jgi:hypothetical protein